MTTTSFSPKPGYVDAHIHIRDAAAVSDLVNAGIGIARDAGTRAGDGLALQQSHGPVRISSAGRALVKAGGYGPLLGMPLGTNEEVAREIVSLAEAGAGIIKAVASGLVSLVQPDAVTPGGFGRDELVFIVQQSAARGLGVMAHANGARAIEAAVAAGVRSLEHGFFMPDDMLAEMAKRRTVWVPTVGALRRAADGAGTAGEMRRSIDRTIDRHLEMVSRAFSLGVPLAVGTDAVLPDRRYSGWYQDELAWFRSAGIPADAVERIAREGGRELLGPAWTERG